MSNVTSEILYDDGEVRHVQWYFDGVETVHSIEPCEQPVLEEEVPLLKVDPVLDPPLGESKLTAVGLAAAGFVGGAVSALITHFT